MVNLVQAWAEAYRIVRPATAIQVAGGGSGVGLAALADGLTTLAAASRDVSVDERRGAERGGGAVVEFTVALDAVAVFVHRSNPLEAIAIGQLAAMYGDGGTVDAWAQVGAQVPGCPSDRIIRIGRQSSSGTYVYFREAVLGPHRDYKLGSIDQSGSKDVVALVGRTPCAIGYGGLAYATADVKALRVAAGAGPAVAPTIATALRGTYPLARALYLVGVQPLDAESQTFIEWVLGPAGQQVVRDLGFVPVGGEG